MPQEVQNLFRTPRTRSHSKTTLANKGVKQGQKASGKWRLRAQGAELYVEGSTNRS
jgi:hypothetical protein